MQEDRFDSWLRESARSYNEPPAPDVEGMWAEIEKQHFNQVAPRTQQWWAAPWLKVAAALVIGVGLGRVTVPSSAAPNTASMVASAVRADNPPEALPALNTADANKYLGETVALLASLQSDARIGRTTAQQLSTGAADLLNTTRFLLDSPTTTDPAVRALLEDLELVLAQIVQIPGNRSASDVDLIHQAMEQRDVMPRLRTAVANNYSAE